MMGVEIKLDTTAIARIEKAVNDSALSAMESVRTHLVDSQTMPFDTGDMQNNQTFVAKTDEGAALITGSPQARRLYYHPEYNFQQGKNKNAGALWLEPYIKGSEKTLASDAFSAELERRLKST